MHRFLLFAEFSTVFLARHLGLSSWYFLNFIFGKLLSPLPKARRHICATRFHCRGNEEGAAHNLRAKRGLSELILLNRGTRQTREKGKRRRSQNTLVSFQLFRVVRVFRRASWAS